ncbi:hypothetical protein QG37_06384 [Candidozyma auris]|uniref:Uncharacterized protein n=1 Tax=Candidozyma auris TaxID=498019 RepID=A0A0L0NT42_CANAR|nr:hypothetical protein QG37_06384 [[Candida] auris]
MLAAPPYQKLFVSKKKGKYELNVQFAFIIVQRTTYG